MDQERVPVLEALAAYHTSGQTSFTPPGRRQGRGVDPRVLAVLGEAVFHGDVLATGGLDDRKTSGGVLARAEDLMAEAVGARRTFFSTCGSSLSVKSAMLAVAGPDEKLVIGRDAHKSVIAGIIVAGLRPTGWTRRGTPSATWPTRRPPPQSPPRWPSTPTPAARW